MSAGYVRTTSVTFLDPDIIVAPTTAASGVGNDVGIDGGIEPRPNSSSGRRNVVVGIVDKDPCCSDEAEVQAELTTATTRMIAIRVRLVAMGTFSPECAWRVYGHTSRSDLSSLYESDSPESIGPAGSPTAPIASR